MAFRGTVIAVLVLGMALARSVAAKENADAGASNVREVTTESTTGGASRVPVHFATAQPGVTVYSRPVAPERLAGEDRADEHAEFEALCEAPCDAALDPTIHEFALAPAGSAPIPATPAFEIQADARFRGDVISRASERRTGWWILGTMGAIGLSSTTIGLLQTCVDDQSCQEWTSLAIWSGIAVTTAGVLIGLPKITASDEATLTLIPGAAPLPGVGARFPGAERGPSIATGLTIAGHF